MNEKQAGAINRLLGGEDSIIEKNKEEKAKKMRPSLLPIDVLIELIKVFEYGAKKYSKDDWKQHVTENPEQIVDASLRHILAEMQGELKDEESGLHHLSHAIVNLMFLLWREINIKEKNNG